MALWDSEMITTLLITRHRRMKHCIAISGMGLGTDGIWVVWGIKQCFQWISSMDNSSSNYQSSIRDDSQVYQYLLLHIITITKRYKPLPQWQQVSLSSIKQPNQSSWRWWLSRMPAALAIPWNCELGSASREPGEPCTGEYVEGSFSLFLPHLLREFSFVQNKNCVPS